MAAPSPSLSLSDIMHPFSPPPMPIAHKSSSPPPRPRSSTPEPLEPPEIEDMRRKVLSMGWGDSSKGKEKAGSREQELAEMLLRLTHPASIPQPSQLHAQAETISHLIQQRDFLVKRSMDEHERWESEKDGWARAAQALIIQGRRESAQTDKDDAVAAQYALVTADASTQRMQEFERANAALQGDKKALQQKLTDTQNRLASLESELAQLKPLLLMQPFALTHSHPTGTARGWSATLPSPGSPATTRREKSERRPPDDAEGEDEPESDDEPPPPLPPLHPRPQFRNPILRPITHDQPLLQPPFPPSPNKPKGDYYRRRDAPSSTVHYPSAQYAKPGRRKAGAGAQSSSSKTTLSDARAEHLLLAARKIGRQRATILSGAFAHMQQPPEAPSHYKQKRPASPSKPQPPKTPRRNANANTPLLTRTPLGQPGASPAQPRTPLQSLLSAAQSVLSAPGSSSMPESPLAKRRKLDHSVTVIQSADTPMSVRKDREKGKEKGKEKEKDKNNDNDNDREKDKDTTSLSGAARVKSALDFLADQAEVYSTQPASQESAGDADSHGEASPDVEMEDASQPLAADRPGSDDNGAHKVKEKANEPMETSRANTPLDAPDADADVDVETQQTATATERKSRGTTPSASLNDPALQQQLRGNGGHTPGSSSDMLNVPLTLGLAPPIDLTPRASRSPPTAADRSPDIDVKTDVPDNRSRPPRALSAPAVESASGSFSMFALQRPQPVASVPGGGPSVLNLSPGGGTLEEQDEQDEGPSTDMASTSRLVEGIKFSSDGLPRRTRSPYIKWTREEDELLAKAVAKHGQKWDLVQKALPSRGYHQVRQRWLRKLGVFDGSKLDLSSLETNAAADFLNISTAPPMNDNGHLLSEPQSSANPKLGLAPLNSEKTLTASSSPSGDARGPSSPGGPTVGRSSSWPAGGHGKEGEWQRPA